MVLRTHRKTIEGNGAPKRKHYHLIVWEKGPWSKSNPVSSHHHNLVWLTVIGKDDHIDKLLHVGHLCIWMITMKTVLITTITMIDHPHHYHLNDHCLIGEMLHTCSLLSRCSIAWSSSPSFLIVWKNSYWGIYSWKNVGKKFKIFLNLP